MPIIFSMTAIMMEVLIKEYYVVTTLITNISEERTVRM